MVLKIEVGKPTSDNSKSNKATRHPKCAGERDHSGDYDCGYDTVLVCEDCKYGGMIGRRGGKDPAAKINQRKG